MSMSVGTVTVNPDGSYTSSGAAAAIFAGLIAAYTANGTLTSPGTLAAPSGAAGSGGTWVAPNGFILYLSTWTRNAAGAITATPISPQSFRTAAGYSTPPAPTQSQAQIPNAPVAYPVADNAWAALSVGAQWYYIGLAAYISQLQDYAIQAIAHAALVTYIASNAAVTVTIPTTSAGAGLQTSTASGSATNAPTASKTITGVVA